jgi:hypothetical protein
MESRTLCTSKRDLCIRLSTGLSPQGLIKSQWGVSENHRRARFYSLTPRGRKQISAEVSNWRRMVAAVNRVIGPLVP